jgi:quercetin dioxygenase-like cupin family protein
MVTGSIQGKVWGTTQTVFSGNNVEVHRIFAKKGWHCSKHRHKGKYNLFYVESGRLRVITDRHGLTDTTEIGPSQTTVCAPGDYHRFEALEDSWVLEVYWVTLDPHDIERADSGGGPQEQA